MYEFGIDDDGKFMYIDPTMTVTKQLYMFGSLIFFSDELIFLKSAVRFKEVLVILE